MPLQDLLQRHEFQQISERFRVIRVPLAQNLPSENERPLASDLFQSSVCSHSFREAVQVMRIVLQAAIGMHCRGADGLVAQQLPVGIVNAVGRVTQQLLLR